MRIVLIFLELAELSHQRYQLQMRAPLGLLYLKSSLTNKGHEVDILDQRINKFTIRSLPELIENAHWDVLGFHVNSMNLERTTKYIEIVRKHFRKKIIVAGGPGSLHSVELLGSGCDAVLHGECEYRFAQYLSLKENRGIYDDIDGISYIDKSGKIINRPVDKIPDIENIPRPFWDEYLISVYEDSYIPTLRNPSATMLASRGCVHNCTFCTTPETPGGRNYRVRSARDVIEEMLELRDKFKVRYITFKDDLFGIKPGWIQDFCNGLIKEDVRIGWFCALHPFSFRTAKREVYSLLKKAGCDCIAFGTQSSSPEILKKINRHPSEPEELANSLAICRELGIRTNTTYIFGLPGETRETIMESVKFCLENRPDLADFHELLILPGSSLAREQLEELPGFSHEELLKLCNAAMLKFYLNPGVLWNFIMRILVRNRNFSKNFIQLMVHLFISKISRRQHLLEY